MFSSLIMSVFHFYHVVWEFMVRWHSLVEYVRIHSWLNNTKIIQISKNLVELSTEVCCYIFMASSVHTVPHWTLHYINIPQISEKDTSRWKHDGKLDLLCCSVTELIIYQFYLQRIKVKSPKHFYNLFQAYTIYNSFTNYLISLSTTFWLSSVNY